MLISFENWQATKTSIKDNELRFWLVSNKNYQGLDLREKTNLTLRKKNQSTVSDECSYRMILT